jgi:hypothetical protein
MHRLLALTMVWALLAPLATAEPLERMLSTPGMTQLPDGAALVYRHRRAIGYDTGERNASKRTVRIERHPGRASVTATLEGEGRRQTAEFRGTTGNPIVLVFLDSVVSRISEAAAANPFYLRRRIKEAARLQTESLPAAGDAGSDLAVREIVLRPFEGSEEAEALGIFATLELTFRLSDAVPGRFVSLRATAGEGTTSYTEEMLLDGTT